MFEVKIRRFEIRESIHIGLKLILVKPCMCVHADLVLG